MGQKFTQGFTLLEMAIVIVVIALLAAGVVGGKTIIRQAELRAVLQEYDRHAKSVKEFLDKYRALPGDMSTAATLWGTDGFCGITTGSSVPTTTNTCNGNGDGMINYCTGTFSCTVSNQVIIESLRAWQHLGNAGLTDARYSGRPVSATLTQVTPGLNVPKSRFVPGGWSIVYYMNPTTSVSGASTFTGDQYGHVFLFGGGKGAQSGVYTTQPILPVGDASEIDRKADDGFPTTGIVRALDDYFMPTSDTGPTVGAGGPAYCVNGTAYYVPDGTYSEKQQLCSLLFIPGF